MNNKEIQKALHKLTPHKKALFLAQDQGLEHNAPKELTGETKNPNYIFNIAEKGEIDAFICQKGLAEKYSQSYKAPLIIKVNGKTQLGPKDDPYSPVTCSVKRASELGTKAIGFTLFPGSAHFSKQIEDFRKVQEEAHDYGLPVTAWMYPRGESIENDTEPKLLQYCARIGLELGADMLKMKYSGNPEDMKEQVQYGGSAKMLMAGGPKAESSKEFLKQVEEVDSANAYGFAVGRNIWKHEKPIQMSKAIRDVQLNGKDIYSALKRLE